MTRIVFLDTETCGLSPSAHIWEVAMIVREPGQEDVEIQTFVRHDLAQAEALPDSFRADHDARYDPDLALGSAEAARLVLDVTGERAHIVGAVPNFDTERIATLMRARGYTPDWHYHLIDVENLAVGYLAAKGQRIDLPWDSDEISARLGITAPVEGRHTALGDCRWARDIYDAVMSDV